jgi:hypothetical protein
VNNATAFDAAVDMLNTPAAAGNPPIRGFLGVRQGSSSRFAGRHDGFHPVQGARQEAKILEQPAAGGQGVRRGIGNPFVVSAPRIGRTQKEDGERRIDQQHIVHRMAVLLAAIWLKPNKCAIWDNKRGWIRPGDERCGQRTLSILRP